MRRAVLLADGAAQLTSSPTPTLDARLLLMAALGIDHAALVAGPDAEVRDAAATRYREFLRRRAAGEPVAYILGEQEFFGRGFHVGPGVLIPRPETELLVEAALAAVTRADARLLDLGTGSGCLAVTLLAERSRWRAVAVDISDTAIFLSRKNAERHAVGDRFEALHGDFAVAPPGPFDLIVGNPPYIETGARLPPSVIGYEPAQALFAGADGFDALRRLGPIIAERLARRGSAFLEIGAGQGARARAVIADHFPQHDIRVDRDLAGLDRMVSIRAR